MSGLAALVFEQPLLFPSPGPTAFLCFESPTAPTASPRDTLIGHAVAILAGALTIFGLLDNSSILVEEVTPARNRASGVPVPEGGATG